MGFPAAEIRMGGTWAFIFTEVGQIMIVKVNPISGLLFYVRDYGIYQLNKKNGLICGRARVLFYDQKMMNPIDVIAFNKVMNYCEKKNIQGLSSRQIALLVDNVQPNTSLDNVVRDLEGLGLEANEATINNLQEAVIEKGVKERLELKRELGEDVVSFLTDYYAIYQVAHKTTRFKALEESEFRIKKSNRVIEWNLFQKTGFARHIALVVIDNRLLDIVKAKTEIRVVDGNAVTYLLTDKYGDFEIEENKNIYRHKKTLVYVVAVKTSEEPAQA